MAKTKQQKEATLSQLTEALKAAKSVVFADIRGLKVSEANAFRRRCRNDAVACTVAKKTLMRLAFAKAGYEGIDPSAVEGSLVMLMGLEDEIAPAKAAAEFAKDHEALKIVAGVFERRLVDAAAVKALAKLPGKAELIAKAIGSIRAPLSGLVNVLSGNLRGLVNVLNAIKDAKPA